MPQGLRWTEGKRAQMLKHTGKGIQATAGDTRAPGADTGHGTHGGLAAGPPPITASSAAEAASPAAASGTGLRGAVSLRWGPPGKPSQRRVLVAWAPRESGRMAFSRLVPKELMHSGERAGKGHSANIPKQFPETACSRRLRGELGAASTLVPCTVAPRGADTPSCLHAGLASAAGTTGPASACTVCSWPGQCSRMFL